MSFFSRSKPIASDQRFGDEVLIYGHLTRRQVDDAPVLETVDGRDLIYSSKNVRAWFSPAIKGVTIERRVGRDWMPIKQYIPDFG